ncbi:MAG: transglycosylase SLT domain-containing protein [Gemmatimonadota bacterium]|nr:MAG: transglycosylase SLT domain-containing protein [Gemmatimonadota bacterium]
MTARREALVLLVCVTAGCATSQPEVSLEPQATRAGRTGPVAVAAPAPTAEDSLADLAALEALHELEFRSLAKGAGHVRGVLPAPRLTELDPMLAAPRGGAASGAGPTYDIDVASFAERDRVRYYVDYFLQPSRDRFTIWLGRLPRYEGMIRERFQAQGVPEDLVYLAIIESGYSNTAVSRSNAVGMWQFIRSTAIRYGLTVNTWVDERRDPYKATEAAARHLADLHEQFGSWYLAAAAYNGGAGRVERGIRRLREEPDSVSDETFFDLSARRYLRRETRDYVPKLIAAAIIAKDPMRFGFDSLPILRPLVFDEITVPDATGLDVIARLADTTSRALMELNPHYVRGVTPPRQSSIVRVPRGSGPAVLQRYAELPVNERVNFIEHIVRRGETLGGIGQRYGVGVSLIRAANNYVDPRRLRIGQHLVIPVSSAARVDAAAGRAPRPQPAVTGVRYHLVRRGETLWVISQRYGVTVENLRRWNGMAANDVTIRVGERLAVVPPAGAAR